MIMHKIVVGENNVPKEENFDTIPDYFSSDNTQCTYYSSCYVTAHFIRKLDIG